MPNNSLPWGYHRSKAKWLPEVFISKLGGKLQYHCLPFQFFLRLCLETSFWFDHFEKTSVYVCPFCLHSTSVHLFDFVVWQYIAEDILFTSVICRLADRCNTRGEGTPIWKEKFGGARWKIWIIQSIKRGFYYYFFEWTLKGTLKAKHSGVKRDHSPAFITPERND